ncbi:terpene synthase [Ganoderma sinense ZZ0214-1]|uniref:Terpene synthase n=1 Tax=Ganoderma sinense ZZ0214-1 TaxID=1077348 RepID=A0A2G8RVS3_9APHY|nr:terpene synthase [Ganoderma sinense ZZ0214-1]
MMNCPAPEKNSFYDQEPLEVRERDKVREVLRDFLKRSMSTDDLQFTRDTNQHTELYRYVSQKVLDIIEAAGDDPKIAHKASITGCDLAKIIYGHTDHEHQCYIALYTACIVYIDDLGNRHLEALANFSRRFVAGEKQPHPALDVLSDLLKESYDLWPDVGADAIVSGTLEAVSAMHVECTTGNMRIAPQATWWPNYFRNRTGICPPYAHFNFMKGWRSAPDSYLQLLPYLEFYIVAANDVLSFYKEQLEGETKNYIHIRATTDQITAIDVLRSLADEVVACAERTSVLIGQEDPEMMAIWRSFEQVNAFTTGPGTGNDNH